MVTGPMDDRKPVIYENTHIITRRGVSSGTITIHPENIPESVMMDFQVEYHRFKEGFLKKHSKVFEGEEEEPLVPDPAPTPSPQSPLPDTAPTPAPEENRDNGAGKKRERKEWREWSETEKDVVRKSKDKDNAVKAYRAMFPESGRSDYAIRQRYDILTKQEDVSSNSTGSELQEKPDSKPTEDELEKVKEPEQPDRSPPVPEDGIVVGVKVRQVKGKERAFGVGTVQGVGVDNLRVKFIASTKVLPRDHFELVKPGRAKA